MTAQPYSFSIKSLVVALFVTAVMAAALVLAPQPAEAAPFCAYNSTQATCECPTSGPGVSCPGEGRLYKSASPAGCYDDPRVGQSPAPDCASNQRLDCASGLCVCDTPNFPCTDCQVSTSTTGASCAAVTGCPVPYQGNSLYQGQYANACTNAGNTYGQNAFKCPTNSTWCTATSDVTYPNTCVPTKTDCPEGTTWNACSNACETATVLLDPDPAFWPSGQGGGIRVTNDIETTNGAVIAAGNVTANGFCISADCVIGWADLSRWTLADNDIYNNNTGNVGIGTTAPNSTLHVMRTSGNNAEIDLQSNSGAGSHWGIYNDRASNSLRFWNATVPGGNALTILPNGNIGIGTTTPSGRFHVEGYLDLGGTSVKVGNSAGNPAAATNYVTAIGYQTAAGATTVDSYLTAVGYRAAYGLNATGSAYSTYLGTYAGYNASAGDRNTAVGYSALYQVGALNDNTAVGYGAGVSITGVGNTLLGASAGSYADLGNVVIGAYAGGGFSGWTGMDYNVAIGYLAGRYTDASQNVLIGYQAGYGDSTSGGGSYNAALGSNALRNTLSNFNVGIGYSAVQGNLGSTTGNANTGIGAYTLRYVTIGAYNTAIGYAAGGTPTNQLTTGSNNTFIGMESGFASATNRNSATAVGFRAKVDCDNCIALGAADDKVGIANPLPGYPLDIWGSTTTGTAVIRAKGESTTHWTGLRLDSARAPATTNDEKWFIGMNGPPFVEDATLRFRAGGASDVMTVSQGGDVTSTGCFGPTFVAVRGSSNGNVGGYASANGICNAGEHVCTPDEIIRSISCGSVPALPTSGSAWVNNGPPAFTGAAPDDCRGWTSNASNAYGAFWAFSATGGSGAATACNLSKPFACCG